MRDKAYRIKMAQKKKRRLIKIISYSHRPCVGEIECQWVDGVWTPVGKYVKYPKNSNIQKYLKKQTSRKVRRSEAFPNGNSYRKCVEYKWQFW